jgi:hypothetical protein
VVLPDEVRRPLRVRQTVAHRPRAVAWIDARCLLAPSTVTDPWLAVGSIDPAGFFRNNDRRTPARGLGLCNATAPRRLPVTPGARMPGAMIASRSPALRMERRDPSYPKSNAKEILRSRVTEPWGHDDATDGAQ